MLGQPAASVCSKEQACAVNFNTATKYYKRQELIFATRLLRGAINLKQPCWPHLWNPFPSPLTLQRANPGAPEPKAAVGGRDRLGEEEMSQQQSLAHWHWAQFAGAQTPRAWSQQGSGSTPTTNMVIKCNHRPSTLDKIWVSLRNPSGCYSLTFTSITQSTKRSRLRKHLC